MGIMKITWFYCKLSSMSEYGKGLHICSMRALLQTFIEVRGFLSQLTSPAWLELILFPSYASAVAIILILTHSPAQVTKSILDRKASNYTIKLLSTLRYVFF